jgi:formylglycine-generating enzyme required for sulfatase activity
MKSSVIRSVLAVLFISAAAHAQCPGDVNNNSVVDGADLAAVLSSWGTSGQGESSADINNDGRVDGLDLSFVLSAWGPCVSLPDWAILLESHPDPAVVYHPALRDSIIATGYAWRVRDKNTHIEMVLIPPSTFQMGCSASDVYACRTDESPVHSVTLTTAFYVGRYEVTQAQWTAQMGSNPSLFQSPSPQVPADQVPNRPVERVSWEMIQPFLSSTGMRLPTEAEWEYACRAGTTGAFHGWPDLPGGTDNDSLLGMIAWIDSNSSNQTRPVGLKAGNGFGLHDMAGNVDEWVSDRYSATYYASSPAVDPTGPTSGSSRGIRGGDWDYDASWCRSSSRFGFPAPSSANWSGFRVARDPQLPD